MNPTTTDMLQRIGELNGILTDIARQVVKNGNRTDEKYRDAVSLSASYLTCASEMLQTAFDLAAGVKAVDRCI